MIPLFWFLLGGLVGQASERRRQEAEQKANDEWWESLWENQEEEGFWSPGQAALDEEEMR